MSGNRGCKNVVYLQAMVITVLKAFEFPCRRMMLTGSVVPVDGSQVMLNSLPALMEVNVVKVNGF